MFATERLAGYCRRRYGPLATLRTIGIGKVVAVWEPELIATIFQNPDVWRGGDANALVFEATAGPSSVFVLDGESHLAARRLLGSCLRDGVKRRQSDVAELTRDEVERWPVGRRFALHPSMQAITLEVMLRMVIGSRDHGRVDQLRVVLKRIASAHPFVFRAYCSGRLRVVSSRLPSVAALREADRLLYEEIAERRQHRADQDDILSFLIAASDESGEKLSDRQLRDHIAGLLVAGHETTAATLAWCFERLVHHPRSLERLQAEILAGEDEPYLDAVINETLRTRPVIDAALRKTHIDAQLGNYILPAGTMVAAAIREVSRSRRFTDPDRFDPEHFAAGATTAPYSYIPFGGGVHRCLGPSLAIMELKTILRVVLQRVRLAAPKGGGERASRWRRVPVSPAAGASVIVTERLDE